PGSARQPLGIARLSRAAPSRAGTPRRRPQGAGPASMHSRSASGIVPPDSRSRTGGRKPLATSGPPRIDRSRVRTVPARRRPSKVRRRDEATPHRPGASFAAFLAGLPNLLGAADLRAAVDAAARAHARGRPLLWGLGAHV